MKWLRFTFLILAAAILQSSALMNVISVTDMRISPNILLILLVYFAVHCQSYDAIICSFTIGFAADIISPLMGPYFISFGIIGTAIAYVRKIILMKKTGQQALTIFVAGLLIFILAAILAKFKGVSASGSLFKFLAISAYSAILWFLVRWPVITTGKWLGIGVHRFGIKPEG